MNKRRILQALTILLLLSLALGSCSLRNDYRYYFAYPEAYTAAYFHQNYVECDPNLIHLKAAENSAGRFEENGQYTSYYAVMNAPVEKYVCARGDFFMLDPSFDVKILRNAELEMTVPEILMWTVDHAELYWHSGYHFLDKKGEMSSIGEDVQYETLTDVDGIGFQSHLRTCVETEDYRVNGGGCMWHTVTKRFIHNDNGTNVESDLMLTLRVHFKEYEYIVWDGKVVTIDGGEHDYYVICHLFTTTETFPEGFYRTVFVPLPAEIAELIPQT